MGAPLRNMLLIASLGLLSAAVAATAQAIPARGAAMEPAQAPALPPKGMTSRAPAMRQPGWVQRDGYVPVPDTLVRPEAPAESNALPPANQWATIDEKPFANDPTGTNVYADTKYAPAAVRAAFEAQDEEPALDPTTSVFATPKQAPVGGMGAGMGAGQGAMLQQSFSPTGPVAAAPSNDIFTGGNSNAGAGAGAAGGNDVFTGGSNGFSNRYTPSVGNAMGSSDMLVSMVVEAPEQTTALGSDAIRSIMGRLTNTPPNRIMVYQTRTINNPQGQPSTAITYIIKNNVDVERSRQQNTFGSIDIMQGFMSDVAKATRMKITPGTIKVSSAVNDGGMGGGAAAGAAGGAMPGQLPMAGGQQGMPGQMMMPGSNGMMMPGAAGMPGASAAAPATPAAPAKSSANGSTAGVLTAAAVLMAALVVF